MSDLHLTPEPGHALKQAIAWRVAVDLVRHYPSHHLRIIEMHPCGGMYDCLAVYGTHARVDQTLAMFNLAGTGVLLKPWGRPRTGPDWAETQQDLVWRYPPHGLGSDPGEFAEAIAARCGLQERADAPAKTTSHLALSVFREVILRHAFTSRPVFARNAWFDTSGEGGSFLRPWAQTLPDIDEGDWPDVMASATRYWSLDRQSNATHPAVIVDIATGRWWRRGVQQPRFANRYAAGASVRSLAWKLELALDVAKGTTA
ncbi:MAG: hypothetical protein RLZZ383_33 [Pseudomonadota bacterium]|jgi:hypothetical protein